MKGKLKNNFLISIIFILFFTLLSQNVYAVKQPLTLSRLCEFNQNGISSIIKQAIDAYNLDSKTTKIDFNSPILNFDEIVKTLSEKKYLKNEFKNISPKCKFQFKYFPDGTKANPEIKNIIYCEYHGSEKAGVLPAKNRGLEEEESKRQFKFKLWYTFVYQFPEGLIILFIAIVLLISILKPKQEETPLMVEEWDDVSINKPLEKEEKPYINLSSNKDINAKN